MKFVLEIDLDVIGGDTAFVASVLSSLGASLAQIATKQKDIRKKIPTDKNGHGRPDYPSAELGAAGLDISDTHCLARFEVVEDNFDSLRRNVGVREGTRVSYVASHDNEGRVTVEGVDEDERNS